MVSADAVEWLKSILEVYDKHCRQYGLHDKVEGGDIRQARLQGCCVVIRITSSSAKGDIKWIIRNTPSGTW